MMLTETDASEAQGILTQAALSQRWQTRQNAIVAWGVLAAATTDKDISEHAVRGLVKAAVAPIAEPSEQLRLMISARDEIAALGEPLRDHAFQTTLDTVRGGTVEGGNAARLAAILSEGQPVKRQLGTWFSLLGVRIASTGRTWVECVGFMTTAAIVIAIGIVAASSALRETSGFSKAVYEGGVTTETSFTELLITTGLAIVISGGLTVPSTTLRAFWSKIAEVFGQPVPILFFIGAAEIIASNLDNPTFTARAATAFSTDRPPIRINMTDLVSWALPLSVLWLGLSVARALSLRTTPRASLLGYTRLVLSVGGWGVSAMLVATWALLSSGFQGDAIGTRFLPAWIGVVCASVAGVALTDSRDTAAAAVPSRKPGWNAQLWKFGGALTTFILVGVAWWLVRQDDSRVEREWHAVVATRRSGSFELKCPSALRHSGDPRSVSLVEGRLYEVSKCQNWEQVTIRSDIERKTGGTEPAAADQPNPPHTDGSLVVISQNTLYRTEGDSPPVDINFIYDPHSSEGHYICATDSENCPYRQRIEIDFATWMIQHLAKPIQTEDMVPSESLMSNPAGSQRSFGFLVTERSLRR